jgi:hypothetical protein
MVTKKKGLKKRERKLKLAEAAQRPEVTVGAGGKKAHNEGVLEMLLTGT